ncbi:hypothetical protein ETB97_008938 [Aspergillus alliaceus]|uniref:Uncharacterized protein n=1 Tax=Petromyces alliaceus TaxID=209559 RepID=A0A8H6E9W2_PETAA|nr:hypothetical protein ETB97_008938 [Aspergillus burnettii]
MSNPEGGGIAASILPIADLGIHASTELCTQDKGAKLYSTGASGTGQEMLRVLLAETGESTMIMGQLRQSSSGSECTLDLIRAPEEEKRNAN